MVDCDTPGVAYVRVFYLRLHCGNLPMTMSQYRTPVVVVDDDDDDGSRSRAVSAAHLLSASFSSNAPATAPAPLDSLAGQLWKGYQSSQQHRKSVNENSETNDADDDDNVHQMLVCLEDYHLYLPDGYEEWSITEAFRLIRDPAASPLMPRGPAPRLVYARQRG